MKVAIFLLSVKFFSLLLLLILAYVELAVQIEHNLSVLGNVESNL